MKKEIIKSRRLNKKEIERFFTINKDGKKERKLNLLTNWRTIINWFDFVTKSSRCKKDNNFSTKWTSSF